MGMFQLPFTMRFFLIYFFMWLVLFPDGSETVKNHQVMQIATTQMHFSFTAIHPSSQLQWDSTGGFFFLGVSFWQYAKAATELKSHDHPKIILAKVDANDEQNKELASLHGVQGFPTLKVFRDGGESVRHYNGPRDAQGIVAYLKQLAGPPSHLLSSLEEAEIIVKENPLTVV
jgi:hypothetical protein